jgi:hypothetical protein
MKQQKTTHPQFRHQNADDVGVLEARQHLNLALLVGLITGQLIVLPKDLDGGRTGESYVARLAHVRHATARAAEPVDDEMRACCEELSPLSADFCWRVTPQASESTSTA